MAYYFPNIDPVYLFQRKGTPDDPYIDLTENEIVSNGFVTLKELPYFTTKVTVKKSDGTTLTEVSTDTLTTNQYRVDYSIGIVYFNTSMNNQNLTFLYKGTGMLSFPASRIWIDSTSGSSVKSLQEMITTMDTAVTNIDNAITNIDTAQQNAIDATNNANTATTNANNKATLAQNKIDAMTTLETDLTQLKTDTQTAKTNADTATANANTATANANNAADNANTKATLAQTRIDTLTNLDIEINQAITDANTAMTNANDKATYATTQGDYAKTEGDYAKTQGDSAKSASTTANDLNTTVQTAEDARVLAETSRVNAENNRVTSEDTRELNETNRQSQEITRQTNESNRSTAETNRATAETDRANAESARVTAENARVIAENGRIDAENTRATNDTTWNANEATRQSQEDTRKTNESDRVTAETARATAESLRVTEEGNRVTAENTRKSNELARQDNETLRQSQETSRQTNTQIAIDNANTASSYATSQGDYAKTEGDYAKQQGDAAKAVVNGTGFIPSSDKGLADGVATLDSNGKVPLNQLPDSSKQQTYVVSDSTARLALTGLLSGDKCFEKGTGDSFIWDGTQWDLMADANWANINLDWTNIVNIPSASLSFLGVVQLNDSTSSTSTTEAATSNSVKETYDLANGKYNKPVDGIPKTDLELSVQTSLGKADTAIQSVPNASTTQIGIVQLSDSTSEASTIKAATANSVKTVNDLASSKYTKPTEGIPKTDLDTTIQDSLGKADSAIPSSEKGVADGVATLGADGLVPSSQLPSMGGTASSTTITDSGSYYTSNDVEGALQESAQNLLSHTAQKATQLEQITVNALNLPSPLVSAKGDGVSDDTIGIQNAIDYAFTNGFQNVLLPPKQTFLISATLKMKKGVKLISSYITTIKTTTAINAIELYDNESVFCTLENIHLDGNGIGLKGVFLNRTNVSVGWDITRFTFKNVFVEKFTSHGIDLGLAGSNPLMEIVMDGVFCHNNGGYGIQSLRATDAFFNNLFLRQNKLGGGYFVANSCKFNNVKAYANGWGRTDGVSYGLYLTGASNMFTNVEAQENTGNGIEINALTNSLLELAVDKNGVTSDIGIPVTPTYDGLTITNSNSLDIRLEIGDMGFTNAGQYSQRYGFVLKSQCKNIDIKYTIRDIYKEYNSESTTNNNINIKKVGIEPLTLSLLTPTTTANGVTFTKISEQLLSINGTATADTNYLMYGAFGDPTFNKITYKAGQKIKVSLANKAITGVTLYMIVNSNTVLVDTNWDTITLPSTDGYINNIYIKVTNGTTLNNLLLKPQIIISD